MKIFTNYFLLFTVLFFITEIKASQETDYFRSKDSGYWHIVGTWESSPDNLNWSDATLIPDHQASGISIRNGHTVSLIRDITVDQLVVDSNAVLILYGVQRQDTARLNISNGPDEVDMRVYGKVIAKDPAPSVSPFSFNAVGVVSFEDGSVYEHNQNGGALPLVKWQKGSTLLLNAVKDTPPFNRSQDYSNIIVDLPELQFNLNMGFQDNIISGDITILNTNQSRWVLVGPSTGSTRSVTIMGDINSAGHFTAHGTDNPNSHAVINVFGDINITGGNFSVTRGSQGGTGTTTWYLHGNLSISDAATQNANPSGAKFVFQGPEGKTLTLNNVTYGDGGLPVEVDGSSLNMGATVIMGEGMFKLNPGSTLITSHTGGLDSALQNIGLTDLSDEASYVFSGLNPQSTGSKLPDKVRDLIINNESGVKLSKNISVDNEAGILKGNLLLNGFILTLGSNATLNETNGVVAGASGKITTTRNLRTPSELNIAGMGVVLTCQNILGTTTIERFHSQAVINGNKGIARQYYISPSNNNNLNADLRMYYHESELDSLSEEDLYLFSSVNGSTFWLQKACTINPDDNYVEITGTSNFSYFTLAYSSGPVSVKDKLPEIPGEYSLSQNYPNPFNPETVIRYSVPENALTTIIIYNALGKEVETLINHQQSAGNYEITWTAENLPSGIYYYQLKSGDYTQTKKMILLK